MSLRSKVTPLEDQPEWVYLQGTWGALDRRRAHLHKLFHSLYGVPAEGSSHVRFDLAIYHLHASVISRSTGKSAVASIAYRSGERLTDERLGQTFDYRRKSGVLDTGIEAPDNSPGWVKDRSTLWNEVEKAETRTNSRTAREVRIALPDELDLVKQKAIVQDFVKRNFVEKGMIADWAIHRPSEYGDTRNTHAHIVLTTREISEKGFTKKNREWDKVESLNSWREDWSKTVNKTLEIEGVSAKIDHRTLKAQGIDRDPSVHLGYLVSKLNQKIDRKMSQKVDLLRSELDRERVGGHGLGSRTGEVAKEKPGLGSKPQEPEPGRKQEVAPDGIGSPGPRKFVSDAERRRVEDLANRGKDQLDNTVDDLKQSQRKRPKIDRGDEGRDRGFGR